MIKRKENYKMIPTIGEFYNNKVDDKIYTYLICLSSGDSEKNTVIFKKDMPTNKQIAEALGMTQRKVNIGMKHLKELNLIEYNERKEIVIIRQENFKLIPLNLLCYLAKLPKNTVKIFTYLLNKYEWYGKNGRNYNFTIKELIEATGRVATRKKEVYEEITNILNLLHESKLINISKNFFKAENSKIGQTERFILNNVSFIYTELEEYKSKDKPVELTEEQKKKVEEYYKNLRTSIIIKFKDKSKPPYISFYYNTGLSKEVYDALSHKEVRELINKAVIERIEQERLDKEKGITIINMDELIEGMESNTDIIDHDFINKFKENKSEEKIYISGAF